SAHYASTVSRSTGSNRLSPTSASHAVNVPPSRRSVPAGLVIAAAATRPARISTSQTDTPVLSQLTSHTHVRATPSTTIPASKTNNAATTRTGARVSAAAPA